MFSGSQEAVLPDGAGVVEPDILLAKMRLGQSIELEAHAVKGAPLSECISTRALCRRACRRRGQNVEMPPKVCAHERASSS